MIPINPQAKCAKDFIFMPYPAILISSKLVFVKLRQRNPSYGWTQPIPALS